ncbi:MAG: transcriptional regulator [Thermotogota bacterium]
MNDDTLLIHQPTRLKIMAALAALEDGAKVDFMLLADELELTKGNLGAHLAKLEEARLVKVEKAFVNRKPKTWLSLTSRGREVLLGYIRELERVVRGKG